MTEWTYDTLAKGHLTKTSRFVGTDTYTSAVGSYDDYYRPMSTTDTIPGFGTSGGILTYTVTNTYKPNGAIATQAFPAVGGLPAETIVPTYHSSTGLPDAVSSNANGGTTYVASTSYFYDGKPDTVILGGTGKRIKQTSTFDAATRRLTNKTTATETTTVGTYSTKLSDTYTYDHAGNITSIAGQTNGVADQQECFTYDHLRRLTGAWTQTWTTTSACTTPQRTGADPYRRQWPASGGYDKLGNRLQQIDKDTIDTTWNYTIGGVDSCGGASKPHAVTSITATGPKAGAPIRTFCYDPAGNTTQRTTDTGLVQTLTWDNEGHLASLAEGALTTSYIYDAAGRRLIASNSNKNILYLPDGTELEKDTNGTVLGQRYYGAAVRDAAGLKWIISNHQGTSVAQIDSLTLTVNRRRMMPFGEPRGTQPTWLGSKGYVGGTKDDTGLVHLSAREYDPTLGRFISVDPVMDLADPNQWNAYAYSHNNPTTFSDPSGLYDEESSYGDGMRSHSYTTSSGKRGRTYSKKPKPAPGGGPTYGPYPVLPGLPGWHDGPISDQGSHPAYDSASIWERLLYGQSVFLAKWEALLFTQFFCNKGPTACAQWRHWLDASGQDFVVDPMTFMDEDNFANDVNGALEAYKLAAIQACGGDSCTFDFDSGWRPTLETSEQNPVREDYAGMGQVQLNVNGRITVSRNSDGTVTTSGSYRVSIYKDWNFDPGEYPVARGVEVPHAFVDLPPYGLARDFVLRGSSNYVAF